MKKIAILYDGCPGHLTASKGVLRSFERLTPIEHTVVTIHLRMKWVRRVLRALLNRPALLDRIPTSFQRRLIHYLYRIDIDIESIGPFDWIISTGGDTSFLNVWLTRLLGIKNIFCSSLRGLRPDLFTCLISARTAPRGPNEINLSLIPVPVEREKNRQLGAQLRSEKALGDVPIWAVLIGGDGAGYHFDHKSFIRLANGVIALAERHGARLLITTSRRTGTAAEKVLRDRLGEHPSVAHLTLYNHQPEAVVAKFIGAADLIFCTADSGSMISEAIAMGSPVYALIPRKAFPAALQPLLKNNIDRYHIRLRFLDELAETDIPADREKFFQPLGKDPVTELTEKLRSTRGVLDDASNH